MENNTKPIFVFEGKTQKTFGFVTKMNYFFSFGLIIITVLVLETDD